MKKVILIIVSLLTAFILISCSLNGNNKGYQNTEDTKIFVKNDDVKIMQLTDLHLTYGFDYLDRKTFKLIDNLVELEKPDIIVVTGDLFMTISSKSVFEKFIKQMEEYKIPWTFIFGNHEFEYKDLKHILNIVYSTNTKYLYFPKETDLEVNEKNGYSNFKFEVYNNDKHLLNLYLFDTKMDRTDGIKDDNNPYDYLSEEQVNWYKDLIVEDTVKSLAFMHIPLRQYLEYKGTEGLNEQVWPQAVDTGLYDIMIDKDLGNSKTLGIFVGHDHTNYFEFNYNNDDILLAYGLNSGFNAYGNTKKGARFIKYNYEQESIDTYLVNEEVFK